MTDRFYQDLPRLARFSQIFEGQGFRSVPGDWFVACTDVVGSTAAIEAGKYKEVNSAGSLAAMAIANQFGGMDFPFFFGGDGMICLVPAREASTVADLLAGTGQRVKEAFGLELRLGLIPVADLHSRGKTLELAKLEISPQYCQAILAGDGFDEADRLLKEPGSIYTIDSSRPRSVDPDFSGYTCRWEDFKSPKDETVALIVRFRKPDPRENQSFLNRLEVLLGEPSEHHPLRAETHRLAGVKRLAAEVSVRARGARGWPRLKQRIIVRLQILLVLFAVTAKFSIFVGKKNLSKLIKDNLASSDYRKYDNTLKMVVALDVASRKAVEALLERSKKEGRIFYGLHITNRAMITCLMHTGAGHEVHFVDAADGGYAYAAKQLKTQMKQASS
jgi:Protein of unknown function (DUF3095)